MASTGGVKIGSSYDEARTRKVNAEAEIAELELAKTKGALAIVDEVVSAWSDTLSSLKAKITTIPSKAAPIVASEDKAGECQRILDDLIREALEELSNYDPKIDAGNTQGASEAPEEGDASSEAASAPKRKRVGRPRKTAGLTK